jgi:hypothetical protein
MDGAGLMTLNSQQVIQVENNNFFNNTANRDAGNIYIYKP